jgi:hypothetical protein
MKDFLIQNTTLQDIADAIRAANGSTEPMAVNEMASAISQLSTGGSIEGAVLYNATQELTDA